jgi:hypothetical protein
MTSNNPSTPPDESSSPVVVEVVPLEVSDPDPVSDAPDRRHVLEASSQM